MLLVAVSDRYKERFSSGNSKMVYLQNVQIRLLHIQKVLSGILDAFVARGKFYFFPKIRTYLSQKKCQSDDKN